MCIGFGNAAKLLFSTSVAMGCTTILFFSHVRKKKQMASLLQLCAIAFIMAQSLHTFIYNSVFSKP
jgi:hypothetical protein